MVQNKERNKIKNLEKAKGFLSVASIALGIIAGIFLVLSTTIFKNSDNTLAFLCISTVFLGLAFFSFITVGIVVTCWRKRVTRYISNLLKENDLCIEKEFVIKDTYKIQQKLMIDYQNQKLVTSINEELITFNFCDIINYEVYENGVSKVLGTAGQAAIGAALFGVAGAIVGSSMSTVVDDICHSLQVRIRLNVKNNNEIVLKFIETNISKTTKRYEKTIEMVRNICSILEYIINSNQNKDNSLNCSEEPSKTLNISTITKTTKKEELQELKELFEDGLITEEDYEQKKKQILGL